MRVGHAIRLRGWWKPKATNLLAVLYSVALITALPFARAVPLLAAALVTILGIGGFGHCVNDLSDIGVDAAAGKPNPLARLGLGKRVILITGLLALALLPWLILPFDRLSVALLLMEFGLLLAYAIPPLRLKERGRWPVFTDAAYAYALPAMLASHTFFLAAASPDNRLLIACLAVWQMALGVRHFLNHLALDRANDLRSGVSTIATMKGNRYVHSMIRRVILPIEVVGFAGYLLVMSQYGRFLLPAIAGILLIASSFHIVLAIARRYALLTYRFSGTQLDWLYQAVLPVVLLAYLIGLDARFSVLLIGHIALLIGVGKFLPQHAEESASDSRAITTPYTVQPAPLPIVLDPAGVARPNSGPRLNIAVANINKTKYTETFVRGLVSRLDYNVYYLHGAELPIFDHEDRYFLTRRSSMHAMAELLEVLLRTDKGCFLKSSIRSYLQSKDVQLVLAEFGPVGIQMLPIARDLGLPLVVCFHGYDVFHRETLELCSSQYRAVFEEAAFLIGVSQVMLNRLESLGAPREKLIELPAFVNLELFPYVDHDSLPPHFLAVGRFAETKSPHLTLLAFQQLCKVIPDATLTMLGKGGGGGLFEACLILAKALGLESRVDFKGAVSHEEVAHEMRHARVFVQHSVTTPENGDMEGKPVAVMEAMASGMPVVATRHSGTAELIDDGVTGFLVPEYDIDAMAAAMIRLANDDALVREVGQNASGFIHSHPLISRHVELMDNIIARAIAGN